MAQFYNYLLFIFAASTHEFILRAEMKRESSGDFEVDVCLKNARKKLTTILLGQSNIAHFVKKKQKKKLIVLCILNCN